MKTAHRVLLLPLLLAPAAAIAQPGRIEITPQIGYRIEGEVEVADDDFLSGDAEIDEGEVFGATVGFPLSNNFQIEIIARKQETALRSDGGLFESPTKIADIDIEHLNVGVLTQWGGGQVKPFFAVSLGIARLDPDLPNADSEEQFSASIGGGVKVYFNDHIGMRFEGRGWYTSIDDDRDYCDRRCYDYEDSGIYQIEGTAGVIFSF
jgi:hypothetical protein